MIVMNLMLDNIYGFDNFEINFSYPRKGNNNFINDEFLAGRDNFRYKKLNIIMGGNATGKTTFGKALMSILNFIGKKEMVHIERIINNKSKAALFTIDFVLSDADNVYKLYRVDTKIYEDENVFVKVYCTEIKTNDSYENCVEKLQLIGDEDDNYVTSLEKITEGFDWFFSYPEETVKFNMKEDEELYLKVLQAILRTLDPSIKEVVTLQEVEHSYIIRLENKDVILQEGQVVNNELLSSGTKNGIDIAKILYALKKQKHTLYYCDEKFSFIHSDVEKSILCQMISSLEKNGQLFFTTHNLDILELPFPKHSYTFLKKEKIDDKYIIKKVHVEKYLKRNTDSLINAYKNDLFSTAPDVSEIDDLDGIEIISEK